MVASIDGIKKVRLEFIPEYTLAQKEKTPVPFDMIFGVGTAGLCAFELSLAGKKVGDRLRIQVAASQAAEFFGHVYFELRQCLGLQVVPDEMVLSAEIKEIIDADNREIVKALAGGGHGCGGSCGCGCG